MKEEQGSTVWVSSCSTNGWNEHYVLGTAYESKDKAVEALEAELANDYSFGDSSSDCDIEKYEGQGYI